MVSEDAVYGWGEGACIPICLSRSELAMMGDMMYVETCVWRMLLLLAGAGGCARYLM